MLSCKKSQKFHALIFHKTKPEKKSFLAHFGLVLATKLFFNWDSLHARLNIEEISLERT